MSGVRILSIAASQRVRSIGVYAYMRMYVYMCVDFFAYIVMASITLTAMNYLLF